MATAKILLPNGQVMSVSAQLERVFVQPAKFGEFGQIFSVGFSEPDGKFLFVTVPETVRFNLEFEVTDEDKQLDGHWCKLAVNIKGPLPAGQVTLRGQIHCDFSYAVFENLKILHTSEVQVWYKKGERPENLIEEAIF